MWAKVGMKCVCIDTFEWTDDVPEWVQLIYGAFPDPKVGEVCEIRILTNEDGKLYLELVGFGNKYGVASFRPLTPSEQKTFKESVDA